MKTTINWDLPDSLISWIWGNEYLSKRRKKSNSEWDGFFVDNRKYHNINLAEKKYKGFKKLVFDEIKKRNNLRKKGDYFSVNNKLHIEDRMLLLMNYESFFTKTKKEKIQYHIAKLKYQKPNYFFIWKKKGDGYRIWRINQKV
jgi:hypothetical protein